MRFGCSLMRHLLATRFMGSKNKERGVIKCCQSAIKSGENLRNYRVFQVLNRKKGDFRIFLTPTRCRDLHLKQFCLEDITPAILIILTIHIIIAVRRMLIKILSVVIKGFWKVKTVKQ